MATRNEVAATITANIYENSAQAITGAKMQATLLAMNTASVTPSGDPMHLWFEKLGASYNETSGYWEMLGVNDMTNGDMLVEAMLGNNRIYQGANLTNYTLTARVVFGAKDMLLDADWASVNLINFVTNNSNLEVVQLSTYEQFQVWVSTMAWAFAFCTKLRDIRNILNVSNANVNNAFDGCTSLERVFLHSLNKNISFADSPLSVESATYLLQNASSEATFSITFKASMQATYEADDDFNIAREAKPNITINYL